ncbi:MAG: DUF1566 domain-containing protein [Chlorobium sp.]
MKFISKSSRLRLWMALFFASVSFFAISTVSSAAQHFVGENYGGGIVFYILKEGDPGYESAQQHGLIAAPADLEVKGSVGIPGMYFWSSGQKDSRLKDEYVYEQVFNTSTLIGQGAENTKKILVKLPAATHPTIAAAVASAYNGGGFNDWYLPSKEELHKLYLNKSAVGGFADYDYWSSTENSALNAWVELFANGYQFIDNKMDADRVRPVRSF